MRVNGKELGAYREPFKIVEKNKRPTNENK